MMKLDMSARILTYIVALICLAAIVTPAAAAGLEQYISITNQEFSTTATADPADNSLGIIHWNQSAFSDATVYFEAVIKCDACSGGNAQATATLYTTGGSAVTNAHVSTTDSNYQLVRTATAITNNLSDNTDYTVRLTRDATAGTASLIGARLVVIQSASGALTATQSQLEIGSSGTTTNTSFTLPGYPKIIYYDASRFAPTPTVTFEASLKSSDPTTIASAALSASPTCASTVSGSSVSVNGNSWTLGRSNAFTLNSGTYYVCFQTSDATASASIANAKLVLTQSNPSGITKTRTLLPFHTTPLAHNTDTYVSLGATLNFNRNHFTEANFDFYYESILTTNGGTAYSRLYNTTDSTAITDSENTTTQTAFDRVISPEITANLPSGEKTLDAQLKNSSINITSESASWLVVDMTLYPSLSFSVSGVPASTTTNGVTTTTTSTGNSLDFGVLPIGVPRFMAHQLSAATNASNGYTVYAKMIATLQGDYPANVISDFPTSWSSPAAWSSPTGTTPNVNTGWFGANTSDTRVPGWNNGSGLFGALGTTSQIVMQSTGIDGGTNAYVTYAIEVNLHQPTDTYIGSLTYTILPQY